jgi:acetoin utilization deacetylase AcuC-like enzyme
MKVAWHKSYRHPLPENHKFPMIKYDLLKDIIIEQSIIDESDIITPKQLDEEILLLTHNFDYWNKLKNLELSPKEVRVTGFPQEESIIKRELLIMQGTIDCSLSALEDGIGFNIAGGTHHSFSYKGEGFCLLNDMAIATNYLLKNKFSKKVLIVDLDVHQGNGTAEIFENKEYKFNNNVFTFSMHGKSNYPINKETSDLDIELLDKTNDNEYVSLLIENLNKIINRFKPDFIQYQSGVDILETDKFGKLSVTHNGCKNRDEIVFLLAEKHQIPIAVNMGGGYSPDINDILQAHTNTFRLAKEIFS